MDSVGWFGKLMFGSMGFMLGGPLGAIAGAALGHHLVDKAQRYGIGETRLEYAEQTQAAYFVSMFSILGKLAKADGVVTQDEIAVVDRFINGLNTGEREKAFARQVFNEAKESAYSLDDFALQFYQVSQGQPTVLLSFLDLLFQIAAADNRLHPAEEAALRSVKGVFRITDNQYDNLKGAYFKDTDRYYKVLDSTPETPIKEIKANYKKLVKDFHPDVIVSKGLPEEFTDFATKRFREIQEAYEAIRRDRGF
jgi:DnaJ like chaperone protein